MAYASQSGRARTSAKNPQAFAVCQRCGIWYNRVALNFQFEWRGAQLQNTYILVCRECMDVPQEQNRAIILPADPVPIFYPSVENFENAESDYRAISQPPAFDPVTGIPIPSTTLRITEDCNNRVLDPFGLPVGFNQNAVMPYNGAVQQAFGVPLALLSVISNDTSTVVVTCSAVHGLATDGQVSAQGLNNAAANGFYSVTVLTATAFSYQTYSSIPAGSLLAPTSRIVTALVGIPRGFKDIPKIYGPPLLVGGSVGVCFLQLQTGGGMFLLQDGSGFLELQSCKQQTNLFELQNGQGLFLLQDGKTFLELQVGH